jgi:hypothetical protein
LYAVLFVFGALVAIAPERATAQNSGLTLVDHKYAAPATNLFGNAAGYVKLVNAASDVSDDRDRITNVKASTSATNFVEFDLLESGPHTGVFLGSFRADNTVASSTPASTLAPYGKIAGDAKLKVTAGDSITLSSATPAMTGTPVPWFDAETGKLNQYSNNARGAGDELIDSALKLNLFGWQSQIFYTLTDKDLNLKPTGTDATEQYDNVLRVWSDSDLTGELVRVTETGANTGVFLGSVGFEKTKSPTANGLVFAGRQQDLRRLRR